MIIISAFLNDWYKYFSYQSLFLKVQWIKKFSH